MRTWLRALPLTSRAEVLLFILFLSSFALGQLGRIEINQFSALYFHDVVIFIWLAIHARSSWIVLSAAAQWVRRHPLVLATVLWIAAGLVWSAFQHIQLRPLLLLGRLAIYALFSGTVAYAFRESRVVLRIFLVLAGAVLLWLGLLQYLLLPDTRFLSILGWDDHYFRLIGTLFDPNFMGMIIVLLFVYSVSLQQFASKKIVTLLCMGYSSILALTYSRASFATAALAGFMLLSTPRPLKWWSMRQRLVLGAAAVLAFTLVIYAAPKPGGEGVNLLRTSSIVARQNTAVQTFENLTVIDLVLGKGLFTNPITASELTTSSVPQHAQVPDNILLLLLSGTGIFGTILILASLMYWIGRLAAKETALAIALGVTLLHAQFNNTLFEPFISLYLLLAVTSPLREEDKQPKPSKRFRAVKGNTKTRNLSGR